MNLFYVSSFIISIMAASTPLLLAASGELITEKSGVLNLGVEGMMLIGAIAGFATAHETGNAYLGILAAAVAGVLISLIFAVLTLSLLANQIATGLALTIFGHGFAALLGAGYVGISAPTLGPLPIPLQVDDDKMIGDGTVFYQFILPIDRGNLDQPTTREVNDER